MKPTKPLTEYQLARKKAKEARDLEKQRAKLVKDFQKKTEHLAKLKAKYEELKNKKHKRRSAGVRATKKDSAWVRALREVSSEYGKKYIVFEKGSAGYDKAMKLKAKYLEDEAALAHDLAPVPHEPNIFLHEEFQNPPPLQELSS